MIYSGLHRFLDCPADLKSPLLAMMLDTKWLTNVASIHLPSDGYSSWVAWKCALFRLLPSRRRSERLLITWRMKRSSRPLLSTPVAGLSGSFPIDWVSKEGLCTRSPLIGSTWRFRRCSLQAVIRGTRFIPGPTHCGLSFVSRQYGAGAVKDWRSPFRVREFFRRRLCRWVRHGMMSNQQSLGTSCTTGANILRAFGRARGARASVAAVHVQHVDVFLGKARPVTRTWFAPGRHITECTTEDTFLATF